MPKADATGLAPKKSARHEPRLLIGAGGLLRLDSLRAHFFGGVSERRPWAFKREDRPKGAPNALFCLPDYENDNLAAE
jgi:hypothetical protein